MHYGKNLVSLEDTETVKKNSQKDKNVTHASVGESRQTEGAEVVFRSTKLTHAGPTSSKTTGVTNTK